MKFLFVVDSARRAVSDSLHLPSMLDGPSPQQLGEMNNLVSAGDYALVNHLSPSGRCDIVKEIIT